MSASTSNVSHLRMQCLSLAAELYGKRHVPADHRNLLASGGYIGAHDVAQPVEDVLKAAEKMWLFVSGAPSQKPVAAVTKRKAAA